MSRSESFSLEGLSKEELEVCRRIEPKVFYQELLRYGMSEGNATSILKMLAKLYVNDPMLFVSKNKATIKAALTYVVSIYLYLNDELETPNSEIPSQISLNRLFGIKNKISSSGNLKDWPGFPPNIRDFFHLIIEEHAELFPAVLGGGWPDWVDKDTFHNNKWIHHKA